MNNDLMFSSAKDDWETPQELFDELDAQYHFTLDAASSDSNAKCQKHYTLADDGLHKSWGGRNGMVKSPIWQGHQSVGTQGVGRGAEGSYDCRVLAPGENGHSMVS